MSAATIDMRVWPGMRGVIHPQPGLRSLRSMAVGGIAFCGPDMRIRSPAALGLNAEGQRCSGLTLTT